MAPKNGLKYVAWVDPSADALAFRRRQTITTVRMISITRTDAIMIGNSTVDPEDDPVAGDVAVVVGAVVREAIPTVVDLVGG